VSTLSEREAALRRALQSAAARIEPAPDGLERIQARLRRPRPVAIAWLEAAWMDFFLRARAALQTVGPLLALGMRRLREHFGPDSVLAHGMRHVWQRFGPDSVPDRRRALRWLRPLAALSLAVFVVAAGTYVGLNGSALFAAGTSTNSRTVGPGATSPAGSGHPRPDGSGSRVPSSSQPNSSATSPECKKTHKPGGRYANPPSSSTSTSPAPSTATSPSPSGTPTSPSPSPSLSSTTSATPNPADTTAATGADDGGAAGTGQPASTADHAVGKPTISTPTSTASPRRHGAKASPSPCASKTTAALTRPAGVTPRESGAITLASAQLAPARLNDSHAG
jgi:hypothetical protein